MAAKKKSKKSVSKKASAKARPAKKAAARPAGLSLSSVGASLTVNDLWKSLGWYCDVLGFRMGERWEKDGILMGAELKAGKVSFWVGQDDWKKGRDRKKGEGFRLYCSTDENVDALAKRIRSKGGVLDSPPTNTPYGTRDFSLTDPDGFKITISRETKKS